MKRTNINVELFKRYAPQKKLEIIENLTEDELLLTNKSTIIRIVKETGRRRYKSKDKELHIDAERRAGNNWNSTVEGLSMIKGGLCLDIYVQYENTDTNTVEGYDGFFKASNYRGEIRRLDRYGNGRTYYFIYDQSDKADVIRSILLEYVYTKYADKLKSQAS